MATGKKFDALTPIPSYGANKILALYKEQNERHNKSFILRETFLQKESHRDPGGGNYDTKY